MIGCFVLLMSILGDSWGKGSKVPFPNELLVDRIFASFLLAVTQGSRMSLHLVQFPSFSRAVGNQQRS